MIEKNWLKLLEETEPLTSTAIRRFVARSYLLPIKAKPKRRLGRILVRIRLLEMIEVLKDERILR